ncbi:MAG TPA: aspartyl/asparaginyl beta-hydroxylase domain-containing protein [Rhizomicrobium sp.]|jgi:aspartyl/asparaginyl beta-hydroxylase (cupin superfamily)|nr:aspartyl/asparaginyl beta-hydroxylase domain-containing protein [Rhizomicrobium sp.]
MLSIQDQKTRLLLETAWRQEQVGDLRAAAMSYRAALQSLPPGTNVAPAMAARLRHASEVVAANNRALEIHIRDGLNEVRARHAGERLDRFDQCLDIMLQKRRIFRQQPTFMYFPELPAIEFYRNEDFPWLAAVEEAAGDIRAELLDVLSDGPEALDPYVTDPSGLPLDRWAELNRSRRWGVYSLWREGRAYPEHIARCPRTAKALQAAPRWDVPGNGPTVLFSILDAKTRIPAHTGPVNTRLVVHLPLVVPPGCGFRVGGQQREWEPGKAMVFDDSIDHEAWNGSDRPRAVLIFDIWSPHLSEAERELTRALTTRIAEYYGTSALGADAGELPRESLPDHGSRLTAAE